MSGELMNENPYRSNCSLTFGGKVGGPSNNLHYVWTKSDERFKVDKIKIHFIGQVNINMICIIKGYFDSTFKRNMIDE